MFKQGDKVICLAIPKNMGKWTLGKEYEVGTLDEYPGAIVDDGGSNCYDTAYGEDYRADANYEFYKCFVLKEKNMKMNYHVLNDSIVLNYEGKTKTIATGDERYERVLACIRDQRLDAIPEIVEYERAFNRDGVELRDGLLMIGEEPMPSELNNRLMRFKEQKLPYDSLLKFWDRLKKNPSFNSRQQLFKFLEHNGHPLTSDGCFIAYRGVREDFKDKHTGTFDNSPGQTLRMPREAVDDNPNNTCSHGFHVACFDYAKGFGEKLVEVKVDPADVVAVPTDYNGTKMRVCAFTVVQEAAQMATDDLRTTEFDEEEEEEFDSCIYCQGELDEFGDCDCQDEPLKDFEDDEDSQDLRDEEEEEGDTVAKRNYRHAKRGPGGRFISKAKKKSKK